jgi:hypothetical protein
MFSPNHKSIALQEIRNKEKYPVSTAEEGTKGIYNARCLGEVLR